jgi:Ca2+-binding RTX toxin-like protein
VVSGGPGPDAIQGQAGKDELSGFKGQDEIDGGTGGDDVEGEAGDDDLIGGNGDDSLRGFAGDDLLIPGPGDDDVQGGFDSAGVNGDRVSFRFSLTGVTVNIDQEEASGEGDDLIFAIEHVTGSDLGGDNISGAFDPNRLDGLGGNDDISGAESDDVLDGGLGVDDLDGGGGFADICRNGEINTDCETVE